MGTGHDPSSITQTLSGTTADTITIDQLWPQIQITNSDATNTLWVRVGSTATPTDAVAGGAGCVPILPSNARIIKAIPIQTGMGVGTIALSVVGNGGSYTVTGVNLNDNATSGSIPLSWIDAKGDLIVGSANDAVTRVAVGATNQVLIPDSSQSAGVKWAFLSVLGYAVNVKDYGAIGNGVADDTTAINSAIAALPAYSAGAGGGALYFPSGSYLVSAALTTLPSGTTVIGAGNSASYIHGSVAGAIFSSASTTRVCLEGIFVNNTSTNAAALTFNFDTVTRLNIVRCYFQGVASTGFIGSMVNCTTGLFTGAGFGGAAGADGCIRLVSGNNNISFVRCDFTDSKAGVIVTAGTSVNIIGCHFEALAGGATLNGAISIDGTFGGTIQGNYFETCSCSAVQFRNGQNGGVWGFVIGGNYMTNMASPFMAVSYAKYCEFEPNLMFPGAISPNANGLVMDANCVGSSPKSQYLASGSGTAVSTGGTALVDLSNGNVIASNFITANNTLTANNGVGIADAKNVVVGTSTGSKIGTATGQKIGFHNATPVIQRAGAAQAAVATTASTQTTPYGFSTQAQADALVTLVNELRAALVEKGLIKGSA